VSETVSCPHKDKCTSYPGSCGSCKKNRGKRNYYEPVIPYPVVRYYPQDKMMRGKGKR